MSGNESEDYDTLTGVLQDDIDDNYDAEDSGDDHEILGGKPLNCAQSFCLLYISIDSEYSSDETAEDENDIDEFPVPSLLAPGAVEESRPQPIIMVDLQSEQPSIYQVEADPVEVYLPLDPLPPKTDTLPLSSRQQLEYSKRPQESFGTAGPSTTKCHGPVSGLPQTYSLRRKDLLKSAR